MAKGELLKSAVARQLGMRTEKVKEHMLEHFTSKQTAYSLVKPQEFEVKWSKRDMMLTALVNLYNRFDALLEQDELSAGDTKAVVSMAKELRGIIMDLAKLEGELKEEQRITIVQYNELRAFIVSKIHEICPKCQNKLLKELEIEVIP